MSPCTHLAALPVTFSVAMVRAIREDRKTNTRRLLKLPPRAIAEGIGHADIHSLSQTAGKWYAHDRDDGWALECPFGAPGGLLWVREDHRLVEIGPLRKGCREVLVEYAADGAKERRTLTWDETDKLDSRRTDPTRAMCGRYMFRSLCRELLRISEIRAQRLQDISEDDAWAEGCIPGIPTDNGGFFPAEEPDPSGKGMCGWDNARDWFAYLWDSLHEDDPWDSNPLVWSLTFERIAAGN